MIQVPVNQILELVLNTDYQGGVQLCAELNNPTPEDDRWAGACLLELGQPRPARDPLTNAIDRGCQAAATELSLVYQKLGEPNIAQKLLEKLDFDQLRPPDRTLAQRAMGILYLISGNLLQALEAFEQA
jgi:tetratricopeptide (TPR) repeat protein